MRSGWDVKAFQKMVVLSATYRQSSKMTPDLLQRDPDNRLLARGPSVRLTADIVRDQALAIAGLLVEKIGGPSVYPYQPAGLWRELNSYEDYRQGKGDDLYRRSLYTFWKRSVPPPTMANFDASSRESCVVRQNVDEYAAAGTGPDEQRAVRRGRARAAQRMMTEGGATPAARLTLCVPSCHGAAAHRGAERDPARMRSTSSSRLYKAQPRRQRSTWRSVNRRATHGWTCLSSRRTRPSRVSS